MFLVKSKAILQMISLRVHNCNSFKPVIINYFKLKNFILKRCIPKGSKFNSEAQASSCNKNNGNIYIYATCCIEDQRVFPKS